MSGELQFVASVSQSLCNPRATNCKFIGQLNTYLDNLRLAD